jgi:hypothetical protein
VHHFGREFRFREIARGEGTGAAVFRGQEILHPAAAAAARRAEGFPDAAGPGRRHQPVRVPEEIGAQFRLGAVGIESKGTPRFPDLEASMAGAGFVFQDITDDEVLAEFLV